MTIKTSILTAIITLLCIGSIFSQTSRVLTKQETKVLIEQIDSISFPVYKAFEYEDNGGLYNLFLCENQININETDTLNTKIEAICYLQDHGGYIKKWKIHDLLYKSLEENAVETNIWFWTKYCSNTDIDGDKLIDPVIVYGTKTEEGFRRIKIITVYKGKKYVIRAVESNVDYGRSLQKDESIKQLPEKIQNFLDKLMDKMRAEQNVILQNG